jgi:hypothetical protein
VARRLALECKRRDAPAMRSSVMSRDARGRTVRKPASQGETANRVSVMSQSHSRAYNTKISCEGRHRECPDLVSCILLFDGLQIICGLLRSALTNVGIAPGRSAARVRMLVPQTDPSGALPLVRQALFAQARAREPAK